MYIYVEPIQAAKSDKMKQDGMDVDFSLVDLFAQIKKTIRIWKVGSRTWFMKITPLNEWRQQEKKIHSYKYIVHSIWCLHVYSIHVYQF